MRVFNIYYVCCVLNYMLYHFYDEIKDFSLSFQLKHEKNANLWVHDGLLKLLYTLRKKHDLFCLSV